MLTRGNEWIAIPIGVIAVLMGWYSCQHSLMFVLGAPEDRYGLWMAALKGFRGATRYVGSVDDYSHFRAGDFLCSRYKAPTAKLRLPTTFPLGQGTPYAVTADMVPQYP